MGFAPRRRDRWIAAAIAGGVQGLLLWVLVAGLAVRMPDLFDDGLKVFGIAAEPPPDPVVPIIPAKQRIKRPEGAASPANLRSKATEVFTPDPVVPIVAPPPIVVAPIPATGRDASSGASNVPGPGAGSGGIGNGTGSGGSGDGDGGGWADETPPRWLKGRLDDRDYPRELGEQGVGGAVGVRYTVQADGRVVDCRITRSSGSAILDRTTCRLIEKRFRYAPSRDARGRPVPADIVETHSWSSEIDPNEDEPPPARQRLGARAARPARALRCARRSLIATTCHFERTNALLRVRLRSATPAKAGAQLGCALRGVAGVSISLRNWTPASAGEQFLQKSI